VADALERLFIADTDGHENGETVRTWSARVGDAVIAAALDESSSPAGDAQAVACL
jgi:hypothetical protein